MNRIKEKITALVFGDALGVVHVNRKEHAPIPDERFGLIIKSLTRVGTAAAGTVLVINTDAQKLLMLIVFGVFFFGMKD